MAITNTDLIQSQKKIPTLKRIEINWKNHKLEIISGAVLIAGSIAIVATAGAAAIPLAALISLVALGSFGSLACIGYTSQKLLQSPAKPIESLPPVVDRFLPWFKEKEKVLPALVALFLYFQDLPSDETVRLLECYLIDQIRKEQLSYQPKSSFLSIDNEEKGWELYENFIQAFLEKEIPNWNADSIASLKKKRADALVRMNDLESVTRTMDAAVKKLLPWFKDERAAAPMLRFIFFYCRASAEEVVKHFTAFVLSEIEKGSLKYLEENVQLDIEVWKLCDRFLTAYEEGKTAPLVEDLQSARREKSRKKKLRPQNIRFIETSKKTQFSINDTPSEIKQQQSTFQEHRPTEAYEPPKQSKRAPYPSHPVLSHIPDEIRYINKINHHLKYSDNPEDFGPLRFDTVFERDPITGKSDFVQKDVPKAEEEFYAQSWNTIYDTALVANRPFKEIALEFMKDLEDRLSALDFANTFYGQELRLVSFARGFNAAVRSSMEKDEANLEAQYQSLLASQEGSSPSLSEKNYEELHRRIDRSAADSYLILEKAKRLSQKVLKSCRETLIKRTFELNQTQPTQKNESQKWLRQRPEELKIVHQSCIEVHQRRNLKMPAEEIEALNRIAEIAKSPRHIECKTANALFAAIEEELLSADEAITHIELPIYFPERLHFYLEEYHRQQQEKSR